MYPVWSWIFLHVELERSQSVSFRLTPPTWRVWKRGDNVGVMLSYGKKKDHGKKPQDFKLWRAHNPRIHFK